MMRRLSLLFTPKYLHPGNSHSPFVVKDGITSVLTSSPGFVPSTANRWVAAIEKTFLSPIPVEVSVIACLKEGFVFWRVEILILFSFFFKEKKIIVFVWTACGQALTLSLNGSFWLMFVVPILPRAPDSQTCAHEVTACAGGIYLDWTLDPAH